MTSSPRPVVTRVLVPTDFSDFSSAALNYAASLASSYGAALRLLHVITPFPIVVPLGDVPGNTQLYDSQRAQCYKALTSEAATIRHPGVEVDVELRDGNPVRETLTAATEWGADLIVVGTHGRGGMERLVLGSVAEKLLRKAPCAVLAVPHGAIEGAGTAERIAHVLCAHDGSAASAAGVAYAVSLSERTGARITLVTAVEAKWMSLAITASGSRMAPLVTWMGSTSVVPGPSRCSGARTPATTMAGQRSGARRRQSTSMRCPMVSTLGLTRSNGSVSQAGNSTTSPAGMYCTRSSYNWPASVPVGHATTSGRLSPS